MKIGLITAMEEEILSYLDRWGKRKPATRATLDFYEAQLGPISIVFVKCGIGKTNAAIATQLLISEFGVDQVICTGVAGALNPDLEIGDIVVSKDCAHHDIHLDFLGFERGHIPYMKWRFFEASTELVSLAKSVSIPGIKIVLGRVLTGDIFVKNRHYTLQARKDLLGDCIEMEGASVAQTCAMNSIPFVIIRSISDKANQDAAVDFQAFLKQSSERSCTLVRSMLNAMKEEHR